MHMIRITGLCALIALLAIPASMAQKPSKQGPPRTADAKNRTAPSPKRDAPADVTDAAKRPAVTFVELGSVNCIPCKKMQSVMKAIEEKYPGTVKVVFHDVWTDAGKIHGEKYKIRLIPTQVFLDADGKEFHRHEGFYPEADIHKLLKGRGLRPRS